RLGVSLCSPYFVRLLEHPGVGFSPSQTKLYVLLPEQFAVSDVGTNRDGIARSI
ncbi:hypothetical protein FRC08_016345, partial [Ceratobasidium sp. 394]